VLENREIVLLRRPVGLPTEADFALRSAPMPDARPGSVLVRTLYLSVDPYMRGRMNDARSYVPPFALNEPLEGGALAQVLEPAANLSPGDVVVGQLPWREYAAVPVAAVRRVDPAQGPVTAALGVLGMTGLTAYLGLFRIGQPQSGETVVVSGAAGAVGSVVGQLAKLRGCRAVGIAGTADKCALLVNELGFDAAVCYRDPDWRQSLRTACPEGVDVYFDNVGGDVTDAVLPLINDHARIPLCGQISLYNAEQVERGPRWLPLLVIHRALIQGFIVSDFAAEFGPALRELGALVAEGKLRHQETIVDGFERAAEAFIGLFHGQNVGKLLVRVAT
jgi:NADPH-dependent curcumin reductase CurA